MFRRSTRLAEALSVAILVLPVYVSTIAAGAEADIYQVGVARIDITPDYPIRLNGFASRKTESIGVSTPIYARAMAISQGTSPPLVLLTIDSLGIRLGMVDALAAKLEKRFEIPRENVALTFTHTHSAPKVNGASDNIFAQPIPAEHQSRIDKYSLELAKHLEQAAVAAIQDRQDSKLEWGIGKVGFAKNRRTPGGPVDHSLPVLLVKSVKSDKVTAVYVSYACHCVTLSFNKIDGDWAGYAADLIEREFSESVALVSIGAGSDSNPDSGVTGDKTDVARSQGAQIADEVRRLSHHGLRPLSGVAGAVYRTIPLALGPMPTRQQLETMKAMGGAAGYNASTQIARLDRGEKLLEAINYPMQTWTWGDELCIVFLAGEVCVDYSLRLKSEFDSSRIWVNAYSNDFCAYIPSERLLREGGYGGGAEIPYFALPAKLQGGLERQIIDELDYSCADSSAGNLFQIDVAEGQLSSKVKGTGGWDRYRQVVIGQVELSRGPHRLIVRPAAPVNEALFDLREVRLVPTGRRTTFATDSSPNDNLPRNPAQIAPFLLDDSQSMDQRLKVIDVRPGMGPAIIGILVADLDPSQFGNEEEYRRIPWIWRVAIACGKRNDGGEIRDLLDESLPSHNEPLRDWQAVVVGGGIINGLTQVGVWPRERIEEILRGAPTIGKRWPRTLGLSVAMADNAKVRSGTRYDALRMVAMLPWQDCHERLEKYLRDGPRELQMGAVSGLETSIIRPLLRYLSTRSLIWKVATESWL